jgi:hypothetical protein
MYHILRFSAIGAVFSVLLAASLACAVTVEGPTPPGSPIPVSTEAAGQLTELWKTAVANPANGQISIVVNETQLTSFLAYKLAQGKETFFSNPQVYLRNNRIEIYGTAKAGDITTTASVAFSATVTHEGALQLQVASANFGPMPVPADWLGRLSFMVNDGLTGSLSQMAIGVKIASVVILDGQMTIAGVVTTK